MANNSYIVVGIILLVTILIAVITSHGEPLTFPLEDNYDDYEIMQMVTCDKTIPREPDSHTAARNDCNVSEMPQSHEVIEVSYLMDETRLAVLRQGHTPNSEDDEWFYYMEGNTLYVYHMPDGYCIFTMDIDAEKQIHQVTINTEEHQNLVMMCSLLEPNEVITGLLNMWIFGME